MQVKTLGVNIVTETDCKNLVCHTDPMVHSKLIVHIKKEKRYYQSDKDAIVIPVGLIEFDLPKGRTIWVQSPDGPTVCRLSAIGGISYESTDMISEAELLNSALYLSIESSIEICLVESVAKKHNISV